MTALYTAESHPSTALDHDTKTLTFSALCNLLYDVWDHDIWVLPCERLGVTPIETIVRRRKKDVVNLLYSLVIKDDDLDDAFYVDNNRATDLFQGNANVVDKIRRMAAKCGINLIKENFKKRIFAYWNESQKERFWIGLQQLIAHTNLGEDVLRLGDFEGIPYDTNRNNESMFCSFAANAILFTLSVSNGDISTEKSKELDPAALTEYINLLPEDVRSHYDPYTLSGRHSHSSAIEFQLMPDGVIHEVKTFHSLEKLLDSIMKKGLLITKIRCTGKKIILQYRDAGKEGYTLKRIAKRDIESAYEFIKNHHNEFREKVSWHGENIEDMAKDGLKEIWIGYAYFDSEGRLASYLDYKLRLDSDLELGIALTAEDHRMKSLSTGLINFLRLKFMSQRLFTGTYEENVAMRKTLETCGFLPNYFYDKNSKIFTCLVRERLDPSDRNNELKYTNSIYYYCNSLLFDLRCAAEQ